MGHLPHHFGWCGLRWGLFYYYCLLFLPFCRRSKGSAKSIRTASSPSSSLLSSSPYHHHHYHHHHETYSE